MAVAENLKTHLDELYAMAGALPRNQNLSLLKAMDEITNVCLVHGVEPSLMAAQILVLEFALKSEEMQLIAPT